MVTLTRKMTVQEVATFFDEFDESYLVPFDCNPNPRLPHDQQRVYRIKDFFIATYFRKICRYYIEEREHCKAKFVEIFFDSLINVIQVEGEANKFKMMADYEHYDSVNIGERTIDSTLNNTDGSNMTTTNKSKGSNKAGSLTGNVDAVQLGSVLKSDLLNIDTSKLPEVVDKNIRQYTQGVNVVNDYTEVTVEDVSTATNTSRTQGRTGTKIRQGIEALNQYRAHSLETRKLREEFVQRFNVLFL